MVIEITEGCVCYSYTIDGKEFCRLADKESEIYDPELIKKVLLHLLNIYEDIYYNDTVGRVYSAVFNDDVYDVITSRVHELIKDEKYLDLFNLFVELVKCNPKVVSSYTGPCEQCGDYIDSWTLELPEEGQ